MESKNHRSLGGLVLSAAVLMLTLASAASADAPPPPPTAEQRAFEMFYGSDTRGLTGGATGFYQLFGTGTDFANTRSSFAAHMAAQVAPEEPARTNLTRALLAEFNGLLGTSERRNYTGQYVLAVLFYGLGRTAEQTSPPYNMLPVRTPEERARFLDSLKLLYRQYTASVRGGRAEDYQSEPFGADPGFFARLAQDVKTFAQDPADHRWYATVSASSPRHPVPLERLGAFMLGHRLPLNQTDPSNPFVAPPPPPPAPPPPPPVLTTAPHGTPVLDFARIGQAGSGYAWRTVTATNGRQQRVLYQRTDGTDVEVGRLWSQGGFRYLNYTGPGGNPSQYGHVFPIGASGLPPGQITALPPGVDYSRIRSQTVHDVTGGTRQLVLLPQGNGAYQDLAGNSFQTTTSQQPVYYACGFRGRRTCMGYQESQEIRPVTNGGAPPARLQLAAASAAPTQGQYSLVTQAQPNEWGARRVLQRNGHPVGYVISVGGQDVIFMGSPTTHSWAIYRMDGTAVTTNFSGQSIISRSYRGRTVHLIPTGGNRYVDVAGRQFEVSGSAVRQLL